MKAIDLSTLVGNPGDVITVSEHTISGDGGGGIFIWSQDLPMPNEDYGIVFGTTTSGRWIRQWSGYVNVRWFGARGDGRGYDGAIGDTDRIQKAIDFCAGFAIGTEIVGGTVFFPPGIYIVASPQENAAYKLILKSRVNLLGCGLSSEIRSALGQPSAARTLSSEPNVVLENVSIQLLHINGQEHLQPPVTNFQRAGIFIYKSKNLRIFDCLLTDSADVIRLFDDNSGAYIGRNEIRDNTIDIGRECIVFSGKTKNCIVESNFIHNCPFATAIKVIEGTSSPTDNFDNIIRGNVCKQVGAGIFTRGGCIVSDNIIEATSGVAAIVGNRCNFIGNKILSGAGGIYIDPSQDAPAGSPKLAKENIIIANNTISGIRPPDGSPAGNYSDGIVAVGTDGFAVQHIIVTGNIIENSNKVPFMAIRLQHIGSNVTVDNNQIYGAIYGIYMTVEKDNTTTRFRVTNNSITLMSGGTGINVGADSNPSVLAFAKHLMITGNLVGRDEDGSVTNTRGIFIQGSVDRILVTGNDTSDTDNPIKIYHPGSNMADSTNLIIANNMYPMDF
jgi:Pectate lyase superfamily protein